MGTASTTGTKSTDQRPPSTLFTQNTGTCANCRKPIYRTSAGGDWYHKRIGSTACYPGGRSWKHATPREVES